MSGMCNVEYQNPQWDPIGTRKHRSNKKSNWERSITRAFTAGQDQPAMFDPHLTDREIESMQLDCLREGMGKLIHDYCHKRVYYRKIDREIGASRGERTRFILVEYHNSGLVHGRPITATELKRDKKVRDDEVG
jgi:hypothetical protein